MLHGQEAESTGKDDTEKINLKQLKNKGIDYLALGHIHTYKAERLDARGIYCYAGCLEGRGFDECGEHGFVVLDIEETTGTYTQKFVPFAQRTLYTVEVDVTGCQTTIELAEKASAKLQETGGGKESLVKLVLKGKLDVECEKNSSYLLAGLKQSFYFVKISDETTLSIDSKKDLYEISLRGEYLRQVLQDSSIADEDKTSIIRYGLQALAGEEIQ